jgi:hypothetical protein
MASTSAFGWETPDDTDLVKDGAAAIRTLGNSIDTSMAELKGGTTGQVLSKTSNTDMDFTWIEQDDTTLSINAQTGTTYTAVAADGINTLVTMDNASANTFSIPTDATYNFPIGTTLLVYQKGAGVTTINAVTSGTTTVTSAGAVSAAPVLARYKSAAAIKLAANSWTVVGGIA